MKAHGRQPCCSKSCGARLRSGYADGQAPRDFPLEAASWKAMKARCENPGCTHYERYGGRGISYSPRWRRFDLFMQDMGPKPGPDYEIDRYPDNNGNYEPGNCRWATKHEQTRNRGGARATRLYTFNGVTLCIADWAARCGVSSASMQNRLNRQWPLARAFAEAFPDLDECKGWENPNAKRFYEFQGITDSINGWAQRLGIPAQTLAARLKKQLPKELVFKPGKLSKWDTQKHVLTQN